ncbi:MAG: FAD-dependent oxidoreductase [Gammaproteobacteria bacterium]|nr:FAD-dependent oxidoreductase [Gammaproteobacteria bacterium]MBT7369507.1 FAD-dependent oxidoreductase [Gammaproteobacteria bacterium]
MTELKFDLIEASSVTEWHDTADVVVIGCGVAGACAAIEAGDLGADVVIIERASGGGGASATSAGIFYLGGGTPVQQAAGFEDSAENMYRFLMTSTLAPDPQIVKRFCDDSLAHFHWLEAQGVPFERSYYEDKTVIPPGNYCLCSTGNEHGWPYREVATPVPRGHKVAGGDLEAGSVAMKHLIERCEQLNVRTRFDHRVISLVKDSADNIVGVSAVSFGEQMYIRARGGVIISAGGFSFNPDMVANYAPQLPSSAVALGIPNNDGDAIGLGISAGAALSAMNGVIATASFYPPGKLIKGIVVNRSGRRFVNEDAYHGRTADFLMGQADASAFLILDAETFEYSENPELNNNLIDGWETIEDMEAALKLPAGSLVDTLNEYNRFASDGEDPLFHKNNKWVQPLDKPPYAAFDISYDKLSYMFLTLGGVKADCEAQVINQHGTPISGLYAAGACVPTVPQDGKGYASGLSLGPGSYYGRIAGRNAASAIQN